MDWCIIIGLVDWCVIIGLVDWWIIIGNLIREESIKKIK